MTQGTPVTRTRTGIAPAAALSASVFILSGCSSPPDRGATDDYPVFDQEATEQDVPAIAHSQDLAADMELPADEVRWVGHHEQTDFYATLGPSAAQEDSQVVCFIIAAHELEVAGASCSTDPYDPVEPTVNTRVGSPGGAVQAFLIPTNTQLQDADGWERVSDHVVVLTDPAAQPELAGTVANDTDIVLQRITG